MATAVTAPPRTAQGARTFVYWHLLSLDAPCVAALWTLFFAWQFHTRLPLAGPLALGIAVWVLYVADRVHDAARGELLQERHRFHLRYTRRLLVAAAVGSAALLGLLFRVPAPLRTAWLLLGTPLALYVVAVHVLRLRSVPKEPLVALFFAAATSLPVFVSGGAAGASLPLAALSFGLVCWLNCAAIGRWEGTLGSADPLTRQMGTHLRAATWTAALLMAPALFTRGSSPIAMAALVAASLLLQLHGKRAHLYPATLRALADAALLTPLAIWPVAAWLHLR